MKRNKTADTSLQKVAVTGEGANLATVNMRDDVSGNDEKQVDKERKPRGFL